MGKVNKKHGSLSGWWFQPTPLKNDGVKVSWDDDIPNIWKVIKFHGSKPPTRIIFRGSKWSIHLKGCPKSAEHFAKKKRFVPLKHPIFWVPGDLKTMAPLGLVTN